MTRPLYPQGKSPCYPLDTRQGGPQSRSGCVGEERNSQRFPELEPSIVQPVAQRYSTEISRPLAVSSTTVYEDVSKSFRTGRVEWELQTVQLSVTRWSCIAILWVSLVSFAAITGCVASRRVFIFVSVYFVIDSVLKLLDTASCNVSEYFVKIWVPYSSRKGGQNVHGELTIYMISIVLPSLSTWLPVQCNKNVNCLLPNTYVTCQSRFSHFIPLDEQGSRVRVPARAGNFYLHHRVQTGSVAQTSFYLTGTRGSFPGRKAAGHLVPRSTMGGAVPTLPNTSAWRGA
jgi:hypothetical protein